MRIAFLIHEMGPGGAERVIAHLANGLASRGHEVEIYTLSARMEGSFYSLDSRVKYLRLGLNGFPKHKGLLWTLIHVAQLVLSIRRHFRARVPDALVAFIDTTNIFAVIASIGLRLPVIISERSDPRKVPLRRIWMVARQLTYPWANALVVQSAEIRDLFLPWIRRKTLIIPNPVLPPPEPTVGTNAQGGGSKRVIAVGRLGPEKGFDVLLQAFARLAPRFPDWEMEIWGEGLDRVPLESLRDDLGLRERVKLPGTTMDIHSQYAQSDLFVLSSRFEGFPNALCEAMSHGLPVVATSCSGGVREILRPGVDGLLVPPEDLSALAEALARMMSDAALRKALGEKAKEVVLRFSIQDILDRWEMCLAGAVGKTS